MLSYVPIPALSHAGLKFTVFTTAYDSQFPILSHTILSYSVLFFLILSCLVICCVVMLLSLLLSRSIVSYHVLFL